MINWQVSISILLFLLCTSEINAGKPGSVSSITLNAKLGYQIILIGRNQQNFEQVAQEIGIMQECWGLILSINWL